MSSWIPVWKRLPAEDETIDGRVPVIDIYGELRWGMLIGPENKQALISDFEVRYWMVPPSRPED